MPAGTTALFIGNLIVPAALAGTTTAFLVGLATQTAIGLALYALSGKGKGIGGGYQVTANGAALDHQIIYGRTKVAGARVFDYTTGTDNEYLHRVLVFAGHEIEEFEEIYINGYRVTGWGSDGTATEGNVYSIDDPDFTDRYRDKIEVYKHLGEDDQEVDTVLQGHVGSDVWSDNHRLRGLAYLYVRMKYSPNRMPNGIPEIKAIIKGKKVYDPRTNTTSWSDNPALCIRDYVRKDDYGLGEQPPNIDGVGGSFADAADVCDEMVSFDGSSEKRYTCNGAFTTDVAPVDILETLLTSCAGTLWYAQGKWRLKAGKYVAPTLTLDENDFIGPISVYTRHSRRDNFNGVRGTYKGSNNDWVFSDYPPYQDEAAITEDGGLESFSDLDLLFTDNEKETQRLAQIALKQNRQQITVQADFGLKAFTLQIGDTVAITNSRFGWSSKVFEVTGWSFSVIEDLTIPINMTLRETNDQVYVADDVAGGWDLSNASYSSSSFDVSSQDTSPEGIFLKPDGTKMYVAGSTNDSVYEYDLSTAWDVSTASYVQAFSTSSEDTALTDVFFKPDGTKMYTTGSTNNSIYEYNLSTAWDVSTASYNSVFYDMGAAAEEEGLPKGVFFSFDGTRMYAVGSEFDSVYQYNLSTPWSLSSVSYVRTLDVSTEETIPESVSFKFDGTKMYVLGRSGEDVNEYDLSDAWNISTATYSQNFSVSTQETAPRGLFIRSNGTKMYVIGTTNATAFEYDITA